MKLRIKFIVCVVLLHATVLVLSYFIFKENLALFLASEVIVLLSAFFFWQLYNELVQPLRLLVQGTEAIRDKDFSVKLLPTGKYELDQLIGVYNHMIDALRTERTQQEMQHFFLEKLVQSSPTGILILDYDEHVQRINPKALDLLGLPEKEVLRMPAAALRHPVIRQAMALRSGQSTLFTYQGAATYKLQRSHFVDQGFPRHFIMIEELTAEILEAEKKTYGKVIRMMAHEVNNTIGPVNSIIQSTLRSQQHSELLTNAMQVAIERNQNLNQFMRNFAHLVQIPAPVKQPADLQLLLLRVSELMGVKAAEQETEIRYAWAGTVMTAMADAQQMEQVFINIFKNALEAIGSGGMITLETHQHPKKIVVRDTGKGISAEAGQQLFSPFYSTKRDGQGIGLTVIREILTNHGFAFSLMTVQPGVTEFEILLS